MEIRQLAYIKSTNSKAKRKRMKSKKNKRRRKTALAANSIKDQVSASSASSTRSKRKRKAKQSASKQKNSDAPLTSVFSTSSRTMTSCFETLKVHFCKSLPFGFILAFSMQIFLSINSYSYRIFN